MTHWRRRQRSDVEVEIADNELGLLQTAAKPGHLLGLVGERSPSPSKSGRLRVGQALIAMREQAHQCTHEECLAQAACPNTSWTNAETREEDRRAWRQILEDRARLAAAEELQHATEALEHQFPMQPKNDGRWGMPQDNQPRDRASLRKAADAARGQYEAEEELQLEALRELQQWSRDKEEEVLALVREWEREQLREEMGQQVENRQPPTRCTMQC